MDELAFHVTVLKPHDFDFCPYAAGCGHVAEIALGDIIWARDKDVGSAGLFLNLARELGFDIRVRRLRVVSAPDQREDSDGNNQVAPPAHSAG